MKSKNWFQWELKKLLAEAFVTVLNRALESDPDAIRALFAHRVECNEKLADDPSIQVRALEGEATTLGMLGLINGLVGTTDDGFGLIATEVEKDDLNHIHRFVLSGVERDGP
jgi:hypothetical protein